MQRWHWRPSRPADAGRHLGLIWSLTATSGAGALALALGVLNGEGAPQAPHQGVWPLILGAFLLSCGAKVRFELRQAVYSFDLFNALLIPAMAFAAPTWVLAAAVVGELAYSLSAGRGPMKGALNTGMRALSTACALVCLHELLGAASVMSTRGCVVMLCALIVAELVNSLGVTAAVSLALGRWANPPCVLLALEIVPDAVLGIATLRVFWTSGLDGAIFLGMAVVVGVEYVLHGRLRLRHTRLRQLYDFERSLVSMVETDQVVAAVLAEALRLLNAEAAELVLRDQVDGSGGVIYTLRAGWSSPTCRRGPHPLVERVGEDGRSVMLVPFDVGDPALREALGASRFRDAIVLRLDADGDTAPAFLVIANRVAGVIAFGPRDIPVAESLTAPAAMALRSSELLMKLREEIASKEHEATHDPLTGLANRILVGREIELALAHRSAGALVGVMVIDMDGFKAVNDGFGHEVGDMFLQVVAARMVETVGQRGHVGRLGGDEFAIVVPYARHPAELATLAADLDIAIREPAEIGMASVERRASIGVSVAPQHGSDRSALLRAADLSMYLAKQRGGGVVVYSSRPDGELDRPSLLAALRDAIANSGLDLCYQPKVALDTGKVVGVEALARWTHPVLGPIPPDTFIPEAESSGLIRPLTRWVLATAIAQCSIWHQEGLDLHVAVNLSPTQMDDDEVVTQVRQLLEAHRLPASSLVLEITESGALEEFPGDHGHVLGSLAQLGVQLSIDDFGVGTSSLARVKHLPVSEIKIDRSFITDLAPDSVDGAIVASTINLAHQLGLTVVAEGVENALTFRQLADLGCDVAQGYLMSIPLRPEDLAAWLKSSTEPSSAGRRWGSPSYGRLASS